MLISWNLIEELPLLMTRIFIAPSSAAEFFNFNYNAFSAKINMKNLF